ncbi:sterol carrier family protein [Gordonia phosphorivorans]|uniref:Sterol carrier family protein n=1 Tax=Gordonia phosphorivorans TaxID=1056982 RepID=A0ABV6H6Q2_9ACTN
MSAVPPAKKVDPAELRAAMLAVTDWLRDETLPTPPRAALAAAVRLSARALAQDAPGNAVEVRVPPFVAVQCLEGVRHTRGTPPNVVETSPRTWLLLATGLDRLDAAIDDHRVSASGHRAADIADLLPIVRVTPSN